MSDKLHIAARAEQDLNSYQAKEGLGPKIAKTGINEMVDKEFRIQRDSELAGKLAPQAVTACPFPKTTVAVGTTVVAHAREYEGEDGPEYKVKIDSERRPGDQDTLTLPDMKHEDIAS
ncbi:hypothetical protein EYZ11_007995 [Aspergillus tanneri]|uniref:Uncharacterized protein n=1 Tax=Aspergillus tanneri TaxID=1220188 RepID=A0A4S3JBX5_9EURO|nr:hypothetical protein EYZ11_007995 [Aspergillus tanneri]